MQKIGDLWDVLGLGGDRVVKFMKKPLRGTATANVKLLCNSHKPAGQVSFRNVHAVSSYAFA